MGSKTVLAERCEATVRGIEETRRRINDKAGLLQGRLKPQAMLRPVTKRLQGTLGEGGEKILDVFRENPLPLTLAALGVGWLFLKDIRSRGDGDGTGKLKEKAGKARSAITATIQENPLILALGALALGAIAGVSIPASRTEEETVGKAAEKAAEAVGANPRLDIPASEESPD